MFNPIKLSDNYYVVSQIELKDLNEIESMGFDLVINNRPEGESDDQPKGEDLGAALKVAGVLYEENPIVLSNMGSRQIDLQKELTSKSKKTLAFCRTGTRSSVLWVLKESKDDAMFDRLVTYVESMGINLDRCMDVMTSLK